MKNAFFGVLQIIRLMIIDDLMINYRGKFKVDKQVNITQN